MHISFNWVNTDHTARKGFSKAAITVSKSKYTAKKDGVTRTATVVRIRFDAMKKARFVIGDRVMIGTAVVNGSEFLAVRRVPDGGYAISGPKENKGTPSNATIKVHTDGIPLGKCDLDDVILNEDGILLAKLDKDVEIAQT